MGEVEDELKKKWKEKLKMTSSHLLPCCTTSSRTSSRRLAVERESTDRRRLDWAPRESFPLASIELDDWPWLADKNRMMRTPCRTLWETWEVLALISAFESCYSSPSSVRPAPSASSRSDWSPWCPSARWPFDGEIQTSPFVSSRTVETCRCASSHRRPQCWAPMPR